jgi:Zn-dependent protease/predicted transcriptional regulator
MRWSIKVARVSGIEVKIHVTFILLLVWLAVVYYRVGGMAAAVDGVLFFCLVFLCVVLHEFGHAIAAKRYGIRTPDITLLPIGGVARLERMPDKPGQEVVVALAGPAVNVVISGLLSIFTALLAGGLPDVNPFQQPGQNLVGRLIGVNMMLVVFNMIPAFPMDGGRVLRALLAMRMSYGRATHVAATVGQGFAFFIGFAGLLGGNLLFIVLGIFIYMGAAGESAHAQMRDLSTGLHVSSAMVTDFRTVPETATLDEVIDVLLATSQHEFPVVRASGELCGLLTRDDLIVALRRSGAATPVSEVMRTGMPVVRAGMRFDRAFAMMQERACPALPVVDAEGRLVGLFTTENVGELLMVHSALQGRSRGSTPPSHSMNVRGFTDV